MENKQPEETISGYLLEEEENPYILQFLRKYVFSKDHKIIARQYLITAIAWAVLGGLMSLVMRLQLGFPNIDLYWLKPFLGEWIQQSGKLDPNFYLSMVTIHGTVMMFFVLTAGLSGTFSNLLIPLQIGARDMASPLLNMLSYWLFFSASVVMFVSLFLETGPAMSGWTSYPPLSTLAQASPGSGAGMAFWIVSMCLFVVSVGMASINYIATVVNMRTQGMSFQKLPLTVWALFFTAILSLLSFPVLLSALLLLIADHSLGTSFYLSNIYIGGAPLVNVGGSPILYQHLFWFLGHPEVYIAILPAFGIISEVISINSRKPIFGYHLMVVALFVIMFLSFVVWAHHMFVSGMNPFLSSIFSMTSFIIAVPSAIKVFNWLTTMWKGDIHFPPAMLFAIGMVSFFITGGLTGLFVANTAIDIQVHDTYFVVAHFHLVMGSASFFGFLTGVYHWFPKMFGRMMNHTLGYIHFWMTFIGVYMVFFPMHYLGLAGFPRRYYSFTTFDAFRSYTDLNAFISIAAFVTFSAQLLFLFNFFYSMFSGKRASQNPWKANTLEWTTPIIPVEGNWGEELPVVHRWPYDYSKPGHEADYIPQNVHLMHTGSSNLPQEAAKAERQQKE